MNLQAALMALCLWCGASAPALSANTANVECYRSLPELRVMQPTGHAWRHRTPKGNCWHIGQRTHGGTFADTKLSQPSIGKLSKPTSKTKTWGSAKPAPYQYHIEQEYYNRNYWEADPWLRSPPQ